jgi:hypothetical protein
MDDYEEIIGLPYKSEDIYELFKKSLESGEIKHIIKQETNEKEKSFDLIVKKGKFRANVKVEIDEIKTKYTKITVSSKLTSLNLDPFGNNKRNVKTVIDLVLKELGNYEKDNDDFSFQVVEKNSSLKDIIAFLGTGIFFAMILFIIIWFFNIFSNFIENGITLLNFFHSSAFWNNSYFLWSLLIVFVISGILRVAFDKGYKERRTDEINQTINQFTKRNKNNYNSSADTILNKPNPNLSRYMNYVGKFKEEKPKIFWSITIAISIFLLWSLFSIFSGGSSLIGKDPCDINYEATGIEIEKIDWCRTDKHGNFTKTLPYGLDNNDFIWCRFKSHGVWLGDGPVYKRCAIKLGWSETDK